MLFVLNTGRAGSRTIANILSQHPEMVCLHEPLPRLIEQCVEYRYGNLDAEALRTMLVESRPPSIDGRRYGESANRLSLAVPVLADAFPDAQFIWLVRDGREVVSSGSQRGWFDPEVAKDTPWERHRLRGDRLGEIPDEQWAAWSPFRRTCWLWNRTNEIIGADLSALDADRSMRLRLEDLPERINDVATFLDLTPISWVIPRLNARLAQPDTGPNTANQVDHRFTFSEWSDSQAEDFAELCGPMMDQWYPDWQHNRLTPEPGAQSTVSQTTLSEIQVDLADLRTLRGELGLLTSYALRVERRQMLAQSKNAEVAEQNTILTGQNANLTEQLRAETERAQHLADDLQASVQRAAELEEEVATLRDGAAATQTSLRKRAKQLADAERRAKKATKRVEMLESSSSFRLGHVLVQGALLPVEAATALRRRLGQGDGKSPVDQTDASSPVEQTDSAAPAAAAPPAAPSPSVPEPAETPGFADLDLLDPAVLERGSLTSFRLTGSGLTGNGDGGRRIEAALAALAPEGVGRVVIGPDATKDDLATLLATVERHGCAVDIEHRAGAIELVVGPHADQPGEVAEVALMFAASLSERLATADNKLRRTRRTLERERASHEARVNKLSDSTQFRIGAAVLDVVHHPTHLRRLGTEFRQLRARRSGTEPTPVVDPGLAPSLDLKVVSILDEFTNDCFAPEFELLPLDRSGWRAQLDGAGLVFVESAWRGNGATWNYTLNKFDKNGSTVRKIISEARSKGIPTLFWNKEDPVSYDVFLPAARAFDAVLTTDRNMVDRYRAELGHDRVDAMAFAAQPRLHNPIGRGRGDAVSGRVCFAGSWRGDKYLQRGSDFDTLLGPPLDRGALDIYDRYAGTPDADTLGFPEPYRSAVVGSLPYHEMGAAYRRYAAFMNVNSVQDSPTMFSRRVFELLACGTPVISTPAQGISDMLGDTVLVTDDRKRTAELVEWVINEPEQRDRHAHRGYRLVHRDHSYERRVDSMLDHVGISSKRRRRRVTVICVSNRVGQLDHVIDSYLRQTYADKEFVFVANSAGFDASMLASVEARVPGARALQIDESATLGDCLNEALRISDAEYFAKFDDDDHYGSEYLSDLMLTFPYSGAAVAGKQTYYAYLEGRDQTVLRFPGKEFRTNAPRVVGGTIVADRREVGDLKFESVPRGTDTRYLAAVKARGLEVFSADRFNFCQVRHADVNSHTWAIDEADFLKACVDVGSGLQRDAIFV